MASESIEKGNEIVDTNSIEELSRVALFGGGRWATVLLGTLHRLLPDHCEILWVTTHSKHRAQEWLASSQAQNIRIVSEVRPQDTGAEAIVIATSVRTHEQLVNDAIRARISTLCEKPLAKSFTAFESLANYALSHRCLLGIHHEFSYLAGAKELASRVTHEEIKSIEVDWFDPWSENRNGQLKHAETGVDIINDQLPHVGSILSQIVPRGEGNCIDHVDLKGLECVVKGSYSRVPFCIRLSRRGEARARRVSLNSGQWILDFTVEPGTLVCDGKPDAIPTPKSSPLMLSLGEFLTLSNRWRRGTCVDELSNWPLSATNLIGFYRECFRASDLLKAIQDERIACAFQSLQSRERLPGELVALIVDRHFPDHLDQTGWQTVVNDDEQQAFAADWLARNFDNARFSGDPDAV